MGESRVYRLLAGLDRLKWRLIYKGLLAGAVAGALVAVYRYGIEWGTERAVQIYAAMGKNLWLLLPWAAGLALASWILYRLMKLEPYAKGSGIPQVEGMVLFGLKIRWYTVLAVRFGAGLVSSLFGVSLGREGPSIQLGAAGAQAIAKRTCGSKLEENCLITAGASAGLASAFNAPLSGILFSLEEVHRTFSPNILAAATSAALTADLISKFIFGLKPVLSFAELPQMPVSLYAILLPLGIIAGAVGAVINKSLLAAGNLYRRVPAWARAAVALLFALPCGLLLPQVLGGGQGLVYVSEQARTGIASLAVLLTVKFLFTCTSFGSGLPGGIFMPILSMGALAGSLFGQGIGLLGFPDGYLPLFCVCAMAGAMAGSVKAPVTSVLLMVEMTGSLVHLLPVATVAFIALLTSDALGTSPIYEELLSGLMKQPDISKRERRRAVVEIPVELGSIAAGKLVREVAWPAGVLIAAVRRGDQELVPRGNTRIQPGDYLIVLSTEKCFGDMHVELQKICRGFPAEDSEG